MIRNILLPLISLISGLLSLFIDPKTDRAKAWIIIAALCASAIASGVYGYQDDQAHAQEVLTAQQQAATLQTSMNQLISSLQSSGVLARNEGDNERKPADTASNANPSAPEPHELNARPVARPVQRPIIQYFSKGSGDDVVTKALKSKGLAVVRVPSQLADATNSIWVGDSVSLAQAKSVALQLVQSGVQLRAIRRFSDGSGPKAALIEIGSDRSLVNAPVLTAAQIESMTDLPSDN